MPIDDLKTRRRPSLNVRDRLEQPLSFPELDWSAPVPQGEGDGGADDRHFDFGQPAAEDLRGAPGRRPGAPAPAPSAGPGPEPAGGIAALMAEKGLTVAPTRTLSQPARRWLLSIPRRYRPRALARQYPHVINKLTMMWGDRGLVEGYFADLVVDQRGGRRGFPSEVTAEILRLHAYFLGLMDPRLRPVVLDEVGDLSGEEMTRPMPLPVRWT